MIGLNRVRVAIGLKGAEQRNGQQSSVDQYHMLGSPFLDVGFVEQPQGFIWMHDESHPREVLGIIKDDRGCF